MYVANRSGNLFRASFMVTAWKLLWTKRQTPTLRLTRSSLRTPEPTPSVPVELNPNLSAEELLQLLDVKVLELERELWRAQEAIKNWASELAVLKSMKIQADTSIQYIKKQAKVVLLSEFATHRLISTSSLEDIQDLEQKIKRKQDVMEGFRSDLKEAKTIITQIEKLENNKVVDFK